MRFTTEVNVAEVITLQPFPPRMLANILKFEKHTIITTLFRAASSQMGTGQVLAAGGAAAAHRRREQEGFEEALASTLGSGNSQHAYSAAGDAYFAAGDAYHAAAGGGAAAASHRRREHHGGFLDPHHQAPGSDITVYVHIRSSIFFRGGSRTSHTG